MKKSRIVARPPAVESPRHLPLVDLLVDARIELFELAVRSGLKVLETMLEEDRTALCGPRYAHRIDRPASRAGTVSSEVVLGGRKVAVQRPRVRAGGREVPLPTFQAMADVDPLNRRVVEQVLVGVATGRYARSVEPVPPTMRSRGTSKSAVSRRFVAKTAAQLAAWQTVSLETLDLVGLLIDGVHIGEHCLIVALGIAADGQKHALGLWDGSTENARMCQDLLANLQGRGLRTDRSLLVILDGSKALRKAVRTIFGEAALVQRCQVHKMRNVLEYLSDRDRPWAQAILRRAYQATQMKTAQRLLLDLAREPDARIDASVRRSSSHRHRARRAASALGARERAGRVDSSGAPLHARHRHCRCRRRRCRGRGACLQSSGPWVHAAAAAGATSGRTTGRGQGPATR